MAPYQHALTKAVLQLSEDLEKKVNKKSRISKAVAATKDRDKKEFLELDGVVEHNNAKLKEIKEISEKLKSLTPYLQNKNLKLLDSSLVGINKRKYEHSKEIIEYTKSLYIPRSIDKEAVTLFALLHYFQKKYVFKNFTLFCDEASFQKKLPWEKIELSVKLSNLPHLLGIRGERDLDGRVCRAKPRKFLDGVLFQWVLMEALGEFVVDFEKLSVIPWMWQTLVMPTYILPKEAIKRQNSKLNADLIFIKRITDSKEYAYHVVCLKQENGGRFTFISQFPITVQRAMRVFEMFDLKKAYYDFYKSKKKTPISSGRAGLTQKSQDHFSNP